jgi:7,8-dihydropterin-6-yl-methyl-4-(beta-D-ribofuranosyl)aminobenzene 5'-phosphate synthase
MYKITALIDNYTGARDCFAEHGLSYFVETPNFNLLFDTGQTESVINNAEKLGIDLKHIHFIVLSHGHYDHTGGLKSVLTKVSPVKIIAHPDIFIQRYHVDPYTNKKIDISNPFSKDELEALGAEFILTEETYFFDQHIYTTGTIARSIPYTAHKNMYKQNGNALTEDTINDDLALIIVHNRTLNIICGCSHAGILNIVKYATEISGLKKINLLIGGFHFQDSSSTELKDVLYELNRFNIKDIAISHCTGIQSLETIKDNVASFTKYFGIGDSISIQ